MTLRKRSPIPIRPSGMDTAPDTAKRAERLVGVGFRCALAGYETQDINCWETGWNIYARELGPQTAKQAMTELTCWVRAVYLRSTRKISTFPVGCTGFCRDECVAISMIAASQHAKCPAMRACAYALLGSSDIDPVVETATSFGGVLSEIGYGLSTHSICDATLLADPATDSAVNLKH